MSAVCVRREGRAVEIELNACCDWPAFYFSELYGLWLLVEAARARFIMCGGPDGHIRDADGDYIYPRLQTPGQLPQAFADQQQQLAFHTLSGSKDQAARRAFSAPYIHAVSYTGTRNWEPRLCQRAPSGRFEQGAYPDDPRWGEAWADLETRHTDIRRNIERAAIEPYRQRLGLPAAMPFSDIESAIEHTDNDLWGEYVDKLSATLVEEGARQNLHATIRIEVTDEKWMPSLEPGYGWDVYVFDDDPMLL